MSDLAEETEIIDEEEEEGDYVEEDEETAVEAPEGQEDVEEITGGLDEVQDQAFEQIKLPADMVTEVQKTWATFIKSASSRDAAGEAIYAALFDSAPSLQSLFKTPRSVMAMRFMNGLNSIIGAMHNPPSLKITVETLGFQHLDLDVTAPRVVIFRDAIVDLFDMELGSDVFSSKARIGFQSILNYVGGAYIYIRREYAGRIKIIVSSWKTANNKVDIEEESDEAKEASLEKKEGEGSGETEAEEDKKVGNANASIKDPAGNGNVRASGEERKPKAMKVPTSFGEMFLFNGAVMGFGNSHWMQTVLEQFDNIVMNVANSYRLQEECDVLSLVLAKYKGSINLNEFKAVMLASLRSLTPKDWDSEHEVAWGWLWENVERMLKNLMGKPAVQSKALERLILSFTEENINYLRREVYKRFFALAPAGQDYFKQSTTRLYWIADKIVEMTVEMYKEPKKMVEDISGLGLRHVGYGIPTEFFAPFVSGAVEVVRTMTTDENAEDAFRWSLTLVSKILVRTIMEGSTIVMKAINTNCAKTLQKAVSVAPRGQRALALLNISVGTQSISPLYWAIESGSLNTVKAMIQDLLVIRADRDNYYYGCNDLFERHPDVIKRLCSDAEAVLPTLLDGLIWRSRNTENGRRRVNYYVKHLLVDADGNFDKALEALVDGEDPKIICHLVVVLFSDLLWTRLAKTDFLISRLWLLFTLALFVVSQAVLPNRGEEETDAQLTAIFVLRLLIYVGSLGGLFIKQMNNFVQDVKGRSFVYIFHIPMPEYLSDWTQATSLALVLALIVTAAHEPIFYCMGDVGLTFNHSCAAAESHIHPYSTASMLAMLLYWTLVTDLSILSTRISSYVLVASRVISELFLFLGAMAFLNLAFATSMSALDQGVADFTGIPKTSLSLLEILLGMFPPSHWELIQQEPILIAVIGMFIVISLIFMLNLLIAQLNGAYSASLGDMVGFARLNRGKIICDIMPNISKKRWQHFLDSLKLDERLEFNEGDVGIAGGIQVTEPSGANPTTQDMITRFGGSTSPATQWPSQAGDDEENRFDRMEKLLVRVTKKMNGSRSAKSGAGSSSMGQSSSDSGSQKSSDIGGEA